MRRIGVLLIAALALTVAPALFAQNHGQVSVFVDYTRLQPLELNMTGLGARVGFNVHKNVQLEGEMGYQFSQTFLESCDACPGPIIPSPERSDLRVLHGLFGPKFQTGNNDSKARVFFTVKGGFAKLGISDRPVTFGNFATSIENLRLQETNGVFYPGGGAEVYFGPFGLRFDAGDEMIFFSDGRRDNLRLTGGPLIRF